MQSTLTIQYHVPSSKFLCWSVWTLDPCGLLKNELKKSDKKNSCIAAKSPGVRRVRIPSLSPCFYMIILCASGKRNLRKRCNHVTCCAALVITMIFVTVWLVTTNTPVDRWSTTIFLTSALSSVLLFARVTYLSNKIHVGVKFQS